MERTTNSRSLSVLRIPIDPNPYQSLSIKALREFGIETTGAGYTDRRIGTGFWTHDIVHIDWLDGFVRPTRSLPQRIRAQTLLSVLLLGSVLMRRPIFWTLHNSQPHSGASRAWRAWKRVLTLVATDTVTLSPLAAGHARSIGLKGSLTELEHGSFLEALSPVPQDQARDRWVPPEVSVLLVHFGQIREQKGVGDLLDAMTSIEGDDVRLVVAGHSALPNTAALIANAAASDPRIVVISKYLEDEELASLLSAADIAAMPFDSSLTSGSAHLAAEFGIAIVAPDSELFRSYGSRYLYPAARQSHALAVALGAAVADCRASCLERSEFAAPSWREAVEPLAHAYRRACDRPRWRRFDRRP